MGVILCGPAVSERMTSYLSYFSPAAGTFLLNLANGLGDRTGIVKMVYISSRIEDRVSFYDMTPEESDNAFYFEKSRNLISGVRKYQTELESLVRCGDAVLFYNMIYPYFGMAEMIRRKGAEPVLLFSDYTPYQQEAGVLKKLHACLAKREMKRFRKVITLSDYHGELFPKCRTPLVLRGGIQFSDFQRFDVPDKTAPIRILFSGTLSRTTGIDLLLDAFSGLNNPSVELVVTGKGDLEEMVERAAEKDRRIRFFGFLDRSAYLEWLERAQILVNPRNMALSENQFNFPSKILEYLASGRVVVSTRFSGFQEFADHLIWCGADPLDIRLKLEEVISRYQDIASACFVSNRAAAEQYDWRKQAERIGDYLK